MNGRVFDYRLGRFYGVDPFIQFPANSQSLNPYSYILNNPLAGTDPTGYIAFFAIPAIPAVLELVGAGLVAIGVTSTAVDVVDAGFDIAEGRDLGEIAAEKGTDLVVDAAITAVGGGAIKGAKALRNTFGNKAPKGNGSNQGAGRTNKDNGQQPETSSDRGTDSTANDGEGRGGNNSDTVRADGDSAGGGDRVKSTRELRGKGNFREGIKDADKRSPGRCEFCGKETDRIERDHFEPLTNGKNAVNEGKMTRQEAIDKFDGKDNLVNSCTQCNRGPGGKHSKQPSSIEGKGRFVPPNPNDHVRNKINELEGRGN